jgi:hypothetical protein
MIGPLLRAGSTANRGVVYLGLSSGAADSFTPADAGCTLEDDFFAFIFLGPVGPSDLSAPGCTVVRERYEYQTNDYVSWGYGYLDGSTLTSSTSISCTSARYAVVGFRYVDSSFDATPTEGSTVNVSGAFASLQLPDITTSSESATVASLAYVEGFAADEIRVFGSYYDTDGAEFSSFDLFSGAGGGYRSRPPVGFQNLDSSVRLEDTDGSISTGSTGFAVTLALLPSG